MIFSKYSILSYDALLEMFAFYDIYLEHKLKEI